MNRFTAKLPILALAMLLIPSAVCCADVDQPAVRPASSACCHQSSQPDPSSPRLPQSDASCCCEHDATLPAKSLDLSVDLDVSFSVMAASPSLLPGRTRGVENIWVLEPGPPLHALQCVWLL
jgi:hypothetical protein